ncbi:MAG: efflux RND transporter permease subunit [Rhizobiales bacterium]|nr:efflux RND transporter permease subunit [Hyphomicrobiales bacterium]
MNDRETSNEPERANENGEIGSLVRLFARHPNAANLLMVVLLIAGLFAAQKLNTQFFPNFIVDRIVVNINWPGASAEDVEANILAAVEPQLRFLEDVKKIDSVAREGGAAITLEYAESADLKEAEADIQSALDAIQTLPEDSEDPEITVGRFFDRVATVTLHGPFPESTIRAFAKRMRDDLLARGVDQVKFTGLRDQEVHVDIPPAVLRQLGMTIDDVATVLGDNTRDLPSGDLQGSIDRQLRTIGEDGDVKRLREMEIQAAETGERLTLGDIGTVERAYDKNQARSLVNGNPAISLQVDRAEMSDALKMSEIVETYIAEARQTFPKTLEITAESSRPDALRARIQLLIKNGLGGLVLVIAVLFVFLNGRVAFWVTAGIPVAIAATLAVMLILGQSINMVSLFALLMMLGIIVDDAIVVGEHTATRFAHGDSALLAAERGAGRMVWPVVAASLTTAAAFGPILLIGDTIGQIMSVIPIVVICALTASLIECFLILPGHLAHSLAERAQRHWSPWRQFSISLLIAALAVVSQKADAWAVGDLIRTAGGAVAGFASPAEVFSDWWNQPSWVSFVAATGVGATLLIKFFDLVQLLLAPVLASLNLAFSWLSTLASHVFNGLLEGLALFIETAIPIAQWVGGLLPGPYTPVAIGLFAFIVGGMIEAILYGLSLRRSRRSQRFGGRENPVRRFFDAGFAGFRDHPFTALLKLSYKWRYVTVALCAASIMVGAIGMVRGGKIGFSFFPTPEAESITGNVVFNTGIPRPRALEILAELEQSTQTLEAKVGNGEKFIESVLINYGQAGVNRGQNVAEITMALTVSEKRKTRTPVIVQAWKKAVPDIPGLKSFSISERRGGSPGRDIDIQLQDGPVDVLKKAAGEVVQLIAAIPGVSGVEDNLPYGKPEITLDLNDRGRTLGLSIDAVGRQVRSAYEGAIAQRMAEGDDEVTLRIKQDLPPQGTAALREFQIRTPAGNFVPLGEVVVIRESQGFAALQRKDGKLTVSVTADINNAITSTLDVIEEMESTGSLRAITSRYGISYRYDGKDKERADAFADLRIGVVLALTMIYIILAWVFGSYLAPLAVMMIIPFGVVGGVVGHYLLGFKLTILSFVGMLGLTGILVNDSLILVSRFQERLKLGDSIDEAAIGASRDRLRAVLLTSLSTIGGLTPLMFETSRQAQFLLPMVITIVFGLAYATMLVLFLVPSLLGIGRDVKGFMSVVFYGTATITPDEGKAARLTAPGKTPGGSFNSARRPALEGPEQ